MSHPQPQIFPGLDGGCYFIRDAKVANGRFLLDHIWHSLGLGNGTISRGGGLLTVVFARPYVLVQHVFMRGVLGFLGFVCQHGLSCWSVFSVHLLPLWWGQGW